MIKNQSIEIVKNNEPFQFQNQDNNDNIEETIYKIYDKIIEKIIPNYESINTELKTKSVTIDNEN
jgi:hypothetical protein